MGSNEPQEDLKDRATSIFSTYPLDRDILTRSLHRSGQAAYRFEAVSKTGEQGQPISSARDFKQGLLRIDPGKDTCLGCGCQFFWRPRQPGQGKGCGE